MTSHRRPKAPYTTHVRARPTLDFDIPEPFQRLPYRSNVRARDVPEPQAESRRFQPRDEGPYGVNRIASTFDGSIQTVQTLLTPPADQRIRIMRFTMWPTTADAQIVDAYFGPHNTAGAASTARDHLFREHFDAVAEEFAYSIGVGLGPVGRLDNPIQVICANANAGQVFHFTLWYTLES